MPYQQLTLEQRYQIQAGVEAGNSYRVIGQRAGCDKSTVCRELNRTPGPYRADKAHRLAQERRRGAKKATKRQGWLYRQVVSLLKRSMTPEAIANRLALETGKPQISHESIYRWVLLDKEQGGDLYQSLVRAFKPYRKRYGLYDRRGKIAGRRPIAERPASAEQRERIGDWEGDTVHGHGGNLVTLVDRKSRYFDARKVKRRTRREVTQKMVEMLRAQPAHTLTLDNGVEFHGHEQIARQAGIDVYFAEPYSSWQRGSNENANGVLRRMVPKGSNLARLTHQRLQKIVRWMNLRPMKCLGWRTPYEVHYGVSVALIS